MQLYRWVSGNWALTFFLGVEFLALAFAILWVVSAL